MKNTILDIINDIRMSQNLDKLENISSDMRLRDDLGLASFDLAELTVRIEDETDIDIFEDGIVNTIGEIYQKLGIEE